METFPSSGTGPQIRTGDVQFRIIPVEVIGQVIVYVLIQEIMIEEKE